MKTSGTEGIAFRSGCFLCPFLYRLYGLNLPYYSTTMTWGAILSGAVRRSSPDGAEAEASCGDGAAGFEVEDTLVGRTTELERHVL